MTFKTAHPKISRSLRLMLFAAILTIGALAAPRPAVACCSCTASVGAPDGGWWSTTVSIINSRIVTEFTNHRVLLISVLWEDNILPAMKMMADQLSVVALHQTMIIGTFFDAKQQLESQQSLQKMAARAHKDYHPSIGLCEFGSNIKSLAASERRSEYAAVVLSQRSQDRALGHSGSAAATGEDSDKLNRIRHFREKFCDPADNNNGLFYLCDHDQDYSGGAIGASVAERKNKDIDFARTIATPWTLNIDFTNTAITDNEEEVLALASNLYGHNVFVRPPSISLQDVSGQDITAAQNAYLDARSVVAKRSVAENSFNAITAMKAVGAPGSKDFLRAVLTELGVDNASGTPTDVVKMLGEDPSYYAQMEVLTKKIYQNPDFFTNLYDTPTNVTRKGVALQAIGLMQKFDLFKSYLRNEASMSVLLELAVEDLQEEVENEINRSVAGGEPAN